MLGGHPLADPATPGTARWRFGNLHGVTWACPTPSALEPMNAPHLTPACAILALLATVAAARPAVAEDGPAAVFDGFGLLGTWSPDCRMPPPATNVRVTWFEEDGRLIQSSTAEGRAEGLRGEVGSAQRIAADLLQFTFVKDGRVSATALLAREGDRIRPVRSEMPDGRLLVEGGRFHVTGRPTF